MRQALNGLAIGLAALLLARLAAAGSYSTVGAGAWNADATWSGTGTPVAGDDVTLAHSVTVSAPEAFGSASTTSSWNAGGALVINGSQALTNTAGTLRVNSTNAAAAFSGGGTFLNQGTFELYQRYSTDSFGFSLSGGTTFENQGTLYLHRGGYNGAPLANVSGASDTLRLRGGSTLKYNPDGFYGQAMPRIYGAGVVTSTFGGTPEAVNLDLTGRGLSLENTGASDLKIGTLTLPAGSVLQQSTTGTYTWRGNVAAPGKMQIQGNGTFKLGESLAVSFDEGFVVSTADVDTNGYTLTSNGYFNWHGSDTSVKYIKGGGTVVNNATLYCRGWNVTTYSGNAVTGGTTIDNHGTLSLGNNYYGNASLTLVGATDRVLMRAGSTLRYAVASGAGGIGGAGQFVLDTSGGVPVPINITVDAGTGTLKFLNTQAIDFNLADLSIGAGAQMDLMAAVTYGWRGDMSSAGTLRVYNGATLRFDGPVTANLAGGLWLGNMGVNLNGQTLTNAATGLITYSGNYGDTKYLTGGGTITNNGTFQHIGQGNFSLGGGTTLDNYGTLKFTTPSYYGGNSIDVGVADTIRLRAGSTLWKTADSTGTVYLGGNGTIVSDTDGGGNAVPVNVRVDAGTLTLRPANPGSVPLRLSFAGPTGSLTIASGAILNIQAAPFTFQGTVAAAGQLSLSHGASAKLEADTSLNLTQGFVAGYNFAGLDLNGHVLTNEATGLFRHAVTYGNTVLTTTGGPASLLNLGMLQVYSTQGALQLNNGVTLQSQGTIQIDSAPYNNYTFNIQNGGLLQNEAGGLIRAQGGHSASYMNIYAATGGRFRNYGTVAVTGDRLYIQAADPQWWSGGALVGGTWKASDTGVLYIVPDLTPVSSIGAGATLIYENGGDVRTRYYEPIENFVSTVGGTLSVSGRSFTPTSGALAVSGTLAGSGTFAANVTLTNGTVNLSGGTINGAITANGGTWSGTGTVTGLTSVSAGTTYTVSGTQNGNVTLGAGATLAGGGTVNGTVNAAGAILVPGSSPGTLTVTTLGLDANSVLNFQLGDSLVVGASDRIDTTNLTLDGTLNLEALVGFGIPAGAGFARYTLLTYQSLTDNVLLLGSYPAAEFNYVLDRTPGPGPGEVFLIIPEPGAAVLLLAAGAGLFGRRHRVVRPS